MTRDEDLKVRKRRHAVPAPAICPVTADNSGTTTVTGVTRSANPMTVGTCRCHEDDDPTMQTTGLRETVRDTADAARFL